MDQHVLTRFARWLYGPCWGLEHDFDGVPPGTKEAICARYLRLFTLRWSNSHRADRSDDDARYGRT